MYASILKSKSEKAEVGQKVEDLVKTKVNIQLPHLFNSIS